MCETLGLIPSTAKKDSSNGNTSNSEILKDMGAVGPTPKDRGAPPTLDFVGHRLTERGKELCHLFNSI
jgi:hypothetical protein